MKLYVNRAPLYNQPWGGGNMFLKALYEQSSNHGVEIVDQIEQSDAALIIALNASMNKISASEIVKYASKLDRKYPIIIRVNENDARKNTVTVDNEWIQFSSRVSGTVWVSDWMRSYFGNRWLCNDTSVIRNGVDKDLFRPQEKLNNGKINIVTHHWSNNYLKGFEIYDKLDKWIGKNRDKYTFTYIGRDRGTFKNSTVIGPYHGETLARLLAQYDVYVSASKADPGPNHILESLSCNIPTIVRINGGGCVDFIENDEKMLYNDFSDLIQLIESDQWKNPIANRNSVMQWEESIESYCTYIKEVYKQCLYLIPQHT